MSSQKKNYLYSKIHAILKQEITEGQYPHETFLPSEKEISQRFQVDRITVRKALSLLVEEGYVRKYAGVGTKVIYQENQPAVSPHEALIGFFIVDEDASCKKIVQPFYSDLFYQVETAAKKFDANILYSTINKEQDLCSILSLHRFQGIIFASRTSENYILCAHQAGIKTAQIIGYSRKGMTVSYDNVNSGRLAVNHLIEAGHTDIALITGPDDFPSSQERFTGALSAFYQSGLILPSHYIQKGDWEYTSGYDCARNLLSLDPPPSAIYVFNDMMALGAIDAVSESGLSIPQDISIISNDNMNDIRKRDQRLSTIGADMELISQIALDYFFYSHLDLTASLTVTVPVTLIPGDTVCNKYHS